MQQASIRSATWCAARCVRHYAAQQSLEHVALTAFCTHLEQLASADSVPEWNRQANGLVITGLGDPLPRELAQVPRLHSLLEAAREVSASQMFGQWQPEEVRRFLTECAVMAGLDPVFVHSRAIQLQQADHCGWGPVVSVDQVARWSLNG